MRLKILQSGEQSIKNLSQPLVRKGKIVTGLLIYSIIQTLTIIFLFLKEFHKF